MSHILRYRRVRCQVTAMDQRRCLLYQVHTVLVVYNSCDSDYNDINIWCTEYAATLKCSLPVVVVARTFVLYWLINRQL